MIPLGFFGKQSFFFFFAFLFGAVPEKLIFDRMCTPLMMNVFVSVISVPLGDASVCFSVSVVMFCWVQTLRVYS